MVAASLSQSIGGTGMGAVRSGVPITLALKLRDALGLKAAVETGTFYGSSAAGLADHFEQVWTIELSDRLWEEAKARHSARANIVFLHGGSEDVLPTLDTGGPALYWLDGHWSVGETAGESNQCPVLDEIRAIDNSAWAAGSAILIDDARLFLAPPEAPLDRTQWPTLMEVVDLLRASTDRYVTLLEDVIVAVPQETRRLVEDYGMSVAWSPPPDTLVRRSIGRARGVARRLLRRS